MDGSKPILALSYQPISTDQVQYIYWGSTPAPSKDIPTMSWSNTNPGQGPNTAFVLLYLTASNSLGQIASEWSELQIPANQPFQVGLGNDDQLDGNMFAFNVGFQFSNTEIPLDDLNLQDYPPSSFTPLPGIPNGTEIAPGGSMESEDIPEPSTLALCASALGLLAAAVRRR